MERLPVIDGILEKETGMDCSEKVKFYQSRPSNGDPSSQDTRIRVLYSNYGLYIAAKMYDEDPKNIRKELGERDDKNKNSDQFGVLLDPYRTGQNAFGFWVNASKVQSDSYLAADGEDISWGAVWKSAVGFDDEGWIVEMEIPYSAIRFPPNEHSVWGINFSRIIRSKGEESYWNYVDNSQEGLVNQSGDLVGLNNITPPARLFLNPFIAGNLNHYGNEKVTTSITAGMDLKYGINESFTLDLSLIPDFSQVQSDNQILNLSPYEVKFEENRPFFTEGMDLFSKAGIFFSRRIGKSFGTISLLPDEEIIDFPAESPLINAFKFSGRTKNGLGIGVLNAITGKTEAKIINNATGEVRNSRVDPITNFNILVLDQSLKNNSNIGIINTNVTRGSQGNNANVTATDFKLFDKRNTFKLSGYGALSELFIKDGSGNYNNTVGHSYRISVGKVSGPWQYMVERVVISDSYNNNDLGFLRRNNQLTHEASISYNIFKPFGIWNQMTTLLEGVRNGLYKPNVVTNWNFDLENIGQLKNFWDYHLALGYSPGNYFDYFDPRIDGYFLKRPWSYSIDFKISSDSRKALQVSFWKGIWTRPGIKETDNSNGLNLRVRLSDKFSVGSEVEYSKIKNENGFVTHLFDGNTGELTNIIFGNRYISDLSTSVKTTYTFNDRMNISLEARHNWTVLEYTGFTGLNQEGDLMPTTYTGIDNDGNPMHDTNFNAFNIDLVYTWQIAPGSFLNFVYKNAIISETGNVTPKYFDNFGRMITSDQVNSVSLKVIYFIDYLSLKRKK